MDLRAFIFSEYINFKGCSVASSDVLTGCSDLDDEN